MHRSYDDLLHVDGKLLPSFKEACIKRGLFIEEDEYELSMKEVSKHKLVEPHHLRQLYVTMLISGTTNPMRMLNEHCVNMSTDLYAKAGEAVPDIDKQVCDLPSVIRRQVRKINYFPQEYKLDII